MKRIRIAKININWKNFFTYIFLILLSSLILVSILIALPLTETISSKATYDLRVKNNLYWSKEYTLELESSQKEHIEKTKSILYSRLKKMGVEKISTRVSSKDEKTFLHIEVESSLSPDYVQELIRNPFDIHIVTKNPDVDFENEEDPYAIYLAQNYIETEFSRKDFRSVYLTQLRNAANQYSYFALFKTWPWDSKWDEFLKDNQGAQVGVSIDGFVTPVQIPTTQPLLFATPVSSTEREEIKLIDILYNSGVVPSGFTLVDVNDKEVKDKNVDYIKLTAGVIVAVIVIYAYLLLIDKTPKRILIESALATVITISCWISYLKIYSIPIDISILAIEVIAIIAILRITSENKESKVLVNVLLVLIASLAILLGSGFAKIFASNLFILILLGLIAQEISKIYIDKVREMTKI